jgi:hypothetical protein
LILNFVLYFVRDLKIGDFFTLIKTNKQFLIKDFVLRNFIFIHFHRLQFYSIENVLIRTKLSELHLICVCCIEAANMNDPN